MPRFALEELIREAQPAPMDSMDVGTDGGQDQTQEISSLFSAPQRPTPSQAQPVALISPLHRPMSRRVQVVPRAVKFPPHQAPVLPSPSPFRPAQQAPPQISAPQPFPQRLAPATPTPPSYPAQPSVPFQCPDSWRNDAGLFLGRSFRVCFGPNGRLFIPNRTYGNPPNSGAGLGGGGGGGGPGTVAVVSVAGPALQARPYGEMLRVHRSVFAAPGSAVGGVGGEQEATSAIEAYRRAAEGAGEARAEVGSTMGLMAALQGTSSGALRERVSEWLEADLRPAIEASLGGIPHSAEGGEAAQAEWYDRIFLRLVGRQIDAACDACVEMGDLELALLVAQAGEDSSVAGDMLKQVEWMDDRHGGEVATSGAPYAPAKLMQIYRLLAGDIDTLLEGMRADIARGEVGRVCGREALDWRRVLGLYLWYGNPAGELMSLPPNGMPAGPGGRKELFASEHEMHLSLQAAFQYYFSKVQQGSSGGGGGLVPHPFPWFLQRRGRGTDGAVVVRQAELVRGLWGWRASTPCARVPGVVAERIRRGGAQGEERGGPPGEGLVARMAGGGGGEWAGTGPGAWAVDMSFQLMHLALPRLCGEEAALGCALDSSASSPEGLDVELAWHVHEVVRRLQGQGGGEGLLAKRLGTQKPLSPYQRCLLTSQFVTQLEFCRQWEMAAYVTVMAAAGEEQDSEVRVWAERTLQELLMRHPPPTSHTADYSIVVQGERVLTLGQIGEVLGRREEEVARWFLCARAVALRGGGAGRAGSRVGGGLGRRRHRDEEMSVCMECEQWERAHELALQLLAPEDMEDQDNAGLPHPPSHTLRILRSISNGMARSRRQMAWEQGAGPILVLLEVWDQLCRMDEWQVPQGGAGAEAVRVELKRLGVEAEAAAEALSALPVRVQRVVVGTAGRVVEALYRAGGEEEGAGLLGGGGLGGLTVLPSKQLLLLQAMAVGRMRGMERGGEGEEGIMMEMEMAEC